MLKKYSVSFDNARDAEREIRKFLFRKSDFILLTQKKKKIIGPVTFISEKNSTQKKLVLSNSLKSRINKEGLFFDYPNSKLFSEEDPVFLNGRKIVGEIITHEPIIILKLTKEEKQELEIKNVKFD